MTSSASLSDRIHLEMLRRLQLTARYDERARVAQQLASAVNSALHLDGIERCEPANARVAERMIADGFAELGPLLTPARVDEIMAYFENRPVGDNFMKDIGSEVTGRTAAQARDLPHVSYPIDDVLSAPHLLELANHPFPLGLIQAYLGCVPTLYSVNLMIANPTATPLRDVQTYHRDRDDFRFVTLFVFLTDVPRDEDGAHHYIRGSQRPEMIQRRLIELSNSDGAADLKPNPFRDPGSFFEPGYDPDTLTRYCLTDLEVRIKGPRGTGFLADTSGIHKGGTPTASPRAVFWARYGLYPNLAYAEHKMSPRPWNDVVGNRLPDDPRTRYVNRLLVA